MKNIDLNSEFLKYFTRVKPSEIKVHKEDIFYRDKYNEIINYIKILLVDKEDINLSKLIKLKGSLLININLGTDIIDFFKLICSNYYLEYIELNFNMFNESPEAFLKAFNNVLENFNQLEIEKKEGIEKSKEKNNFNLFLINDKINLSKILQGKGLLDVFLNYFLYSKEEINFVHKNMIIIWINYDYDKLVEYSNEIYKIFDLVIKIPLLTKIERETLLRDFTEKNSNISFDINSIVNRLENWESNDIRQLLTIGIFKHYINRDLNEKSNEITEILENLVANGEVLPSKIIKISNEASNKEIYKPSRSTLEKSSDFNSEVQENYGEREKVINQIKNEPISDFMLNQLYENAASKNYNELLIIIDKLIKREILEENDRKLLAKYPFILNEAPNLAQIHLEKAKKRVDIIRHAFNR